MDKDKRERLLRDFGDERPDEPGFFHRVATRIAKSNADFALDCAPSAYGSRRKAISAHRANVRDTLDEYGISKQSGFYKLALKAFSERVELLTVAQRKARAERVLREIKVKAAIQVGQRVVTVECSAAEDSDAGVVHSVRADGVVIVGWDSGVVTPCDVRWLRAEGSVGK